MKVFIGVLVLILFTEFENVVAFPAIARPKPRRNRMHKGGRFSEGKIKQKAVESQTGDTGRRNLLTDETETVMEAKHEMAELLSSATSGIDDIIVSYEGVATLTAPLKVELTFEDITFDLDFVKFGDIVEKIEILRYTRQMVIWIKSVGQDRKNTIEDVFEIFEDVEAVYIVEADSALIYRGINDEAFTVNDPGINSQWYIENPRFPPFHVNLLGAWKIIEERQLDTIDVVIGVGDKGFYFEHPDLTDSFWTNPDDAADGVDNDENGCTDDIHGCNLDRNDGRFSPASTTLYHGTFTAGIIAAKTNDENGMAGCSYRNNLKLLLAEVSSVTTASKALNYMYGHGIKLSSHSYGKMEEQITLLRNIKIAVEFDHLTVWAVGNNGIDISDPRGSTLDYPSTYNLPYMINVANLEVKGKINYHSNYGKSTVHIAAPGTDIYSAIPPKLDIYGQRTVHAVHSGTSYATPVVSGIAGLVLSAFPNFSAQQLKRVVLSSYRTVDDMKDKAMYPGMPNAGRAIEFAICEEEFNAAASQCLPHPSPSSEEIASWGSSEYASDTAIKCQDYCRVHMCIAESISSPSCRARTCEILDGVCADFRIKLAAITDEEVIPFQCEACVNQRILYSDYVHLYIRSEISNITQLYTIGESLQQSFLRNLPIFEATLDAIKPNVQNSGFNSFTYILSSSTNANVEQLLIEEMHVNTCSQLRQESFYIENCADCCFLERPAKYNDGTLIKCPSITSCITTTTTTITTTTTTSGAAFLRGRESIYSATACVFLNVFLIYVL